MSIVYLIPGNLSSSNYGVKEIRRRENLLKKWSYDPSKIKVFDIENILKKIGKHFFETIFFRKKIIGKVNKK